jgi:hypothetical protein
MRPSWVVFELTFDERASVAFGHFARAAPFQPECNGNRQSRYLNLSRRRRQIQRGMGQSQRSPMQSLMI